MHNSSLRRPLWALASVLSLAFSGFAAAEPPSRAARLGVIGGTVSFSPAGQRDWVQAAVNRPLTTGDRLWTAGASRAELQIGGAAFRMGPSTSMVLLNLDDRIAQVQLSRGTLKIRVRSLGPRQSVEVATPNLALTLRRAGEYRIEVDPEDDATDVMVTSGQAEVYGEGASYTVTSRRGYRFYGTDLSDYETATARRDDEFDRWSRERDRLAERSASARFVSSEVVGYEDLDANGSWRVDATYGNVWTPRRVAADWTPYRDGHWSWVDPWGWTWVDDAPWGYAVSHYGRWARIDQSWAWVPGPRRERAIYAPALVAFVGGKNFQVSVTAGNTAPATVGWFPLAPREVYRPTYAVSRSYFDNINRSNAVVAPATLANVYNTTIVNNTTNVTNTKTNITNNTTNVTNIIYANQRVSGAVVAVPTQAFVQSKQVAAAAVRVSQEVVANAPVVRVAEVAPVQQSVQGGAREAAARPPLRERERTVVARTALPPAALPFAVQQAQLAARPGTPIDAAQRTQLKAAAPPASAPTVNVVAAAAAPAATALPPATPPAGRSPEERKAGIAKADERRAAREARAEGRGPGANEAAGARAEAPRSDAAADVTKAAAARATAAEALKAEESKAAAAKAAAVQADAAKVASAKAAEAAKAATAKADAADAARVANAKAADGKAAEVKAADAAKAATAKADAADAAKVASAKAADAKAAEAKATADAARATSAKAEAATAEALRADNAKKAALKGEAAKAEAANAEASRAAAAKAAAEGAAASKAAVDKATDAKNAKAKVAEASAAKGEAARAEAARADGKAARANAEAAKAASARTNANQAEPARADAAKAATEAARAAGGQANRPVDAPAPGARASGPRSDADENREKRKKRTEGRD